MPLARHLRGGGRWGFCLVLLLAGPAAAGEDRSPIPTRRPTAARWPDSGCRVPAGTRCGQDGDALCPRCHDGQTTAPDVLGENTGSHVRQAGALATGRPSTSAARDTSSRRLRRRRAARRWPRCTVPVVTSRTAPPTTAISCSATYPKATNDRTKDVFVRRWTRGAIAGDCSADTVDFNEQDPSGSAIANRPYRVKVVSPLGTWGTQGAPWPDAPARLTPTRVSCHRAHGNQNAFVLIQPTTTQPISEQGGGRSPRGRSASALASRRLAGTRARPKG